MSLSNKHKVQKFYQREEIAQNYSKRYQGIKGKYFQRLESDLILEMADFRDKKVLDIGTGTGRLAFLISDMADEVIGIDFSQAMIREAGKERKRLGKENIKFKVGDAQNTSFPNNHFDIVVSVGTFEYVSNLEPYLGETNRILKQGGKFIFTCHNKRKIFPRKNTLIKKIPYAFKKKVFDKMASTLIVSAIKNKYKNEF